MSLVIRKPGILTTVQDLGRFGFRSLGVNPNGPMDTTAARAINIALGDDENAAVLEMHFPAPDIEFSEDTAFCIGGADFCPELDGKPISNWTTQVARKGQRLRFQTRIFGNRSYLAVNGGCVSPEWLGSKSTNLLASVGGNDGRALESGDTIACKSSHLEKTIRIGHSLIPDYCRAPTARVIPGAEFELLTAISERSLQTEIFTLTADSNRMGFRLQGEPLHLLHPKELVSAATTFGTIQLLPDGQMIVLMADHQTAGGYPRIGNIISADLPIAGQLGSGDRISFKLVSNVEAETAQLALERDLRFFRVGCRLTVGGQSNL